MQEILGQAADFQNDFLKRWRSGGGKTLGYACAATPIEVIEAAGLMPYRIRGLGNSRTEIADAHLSRFNCSFCRSCLQLGLDGTYDFLDGLIESNGCDHIRGMFENWQYVRPSGFFHYLKVPHIVTEDSLAYFAEELRLFGEAIRGHFEVELDHGRLWRSIEQQGRIRGKLAGIYELRMEDRVRGSEALSMFLLGTAVPADEFERMLDRVIEQRAGHNIGPYRARLMLGGSATDEVGLLRLIEDLGGHLATDMLCYGSRAFWGREVRRSDDPYRALAEAYLRNLPCPRMFDEFAYRRGLAMDAARRADVDGAILVHNKFCDVHGVDNVQLRMALEKEGIPVLTLEKEYGAMADLGRMRTRVQAFLERICGR